MAQELMTLEESRKLDRDPARLWWYYWEVMNGRMPPTAAQYVPVGYYRYNQRDGKSFPLAIWIGADGVKRAQLGTFKTKLLSTPEIEGAFAFDTFASCADRAVPHADYLFWLEHKAWPISSAVNTAVEDSLKPAEQLRGIGDNSIGPTDDHATFLDQVNAALAGLPGATAITDDDTLATAQSLRSRLSELAKEGDDKRAAEKEPHLKAGRDVDDKWQPTIKDARAAASSIKAAMEVFESARIRAEKARLKAEAEAAAKAEEERLAAEKAASRVLVSGGADPAPAAPPPATPPQEDTPKPRAIRGAYGRAASAKMKPVIKTIDHRVVFDALVDTNTAMQAYVKDIAQKIVNSGGTVAGITTEEQAKIR